MDIRDITEVVYPQSGTPFMKAIFELQAELLQEYLKIEKLKPWPWNLNLPADQIVIKDFIARVVEELGEGYESYFNNYQALKAKTMTFDKVKTNIYNLNEEIADALHFLVELFIVSGITYDYLINWGLTKMFPITPSVEHYNDLYYIFDEGVTVPPQFDDSPQVLHLVGHEDFYGMGGTEITLYRLQDFSKRAWEVTYHLQLARNTLKNKPWKQTHMQSDKRVFQHELAETLQAFIALTRSLGINEKALYEIYYRKNQINRFRVKSKY